MSVLVPLLWMSACTDFVGASDPIDAESAGSDAAGTTSNESAGSDPTVDTASASGSGTTGNGSNASASTSGTADPTSDPTSDSTSDTTTTDGTTGGPGSTGTGGESGTGSTGGTSGSSSGSSSSSSSTGDEGDALLGMACMGDGDCDMEAGQVCCDAAQCLDTCMVPCMDVKDCPFEDMGCEHGHCLFPCDDNDEDCAEWPGYTCQHGGQYCENDAM